MNKIFMILILAFSINLKSQQDLDLIKIEALKTINQINSNIKNGKLNEKNISELFCEKIYCFVCDEKYYNEDFLIENNKIYYNLKDLIVFLNVEKLRKSGITENRDTNEYLLGYELTMPNPKTGFEGSGALISFKRENGKIKLFGIQTIP